jgi:hypothetical protein
VVLNTQPTGNVTITPNSNDTGAATVSAAMTFTSANYRHRFIIYVIISNTCHSNSLWCAPVSTSKGHGGAHGGSTCIIAVRRNRHIACWLCIKYHGVSTISHTITGAGYAGVTSANVIASVTDDEIFFNNLVYSTVTSPDTGKVWLDRNLGATQVATSKTDSAAYGHYYQWGRNDDGHESHL